MVNDYYQLRVTGRGSRVAGHGSRVAGHGSRVTGRGLVTEDCYFFNPTALLIEFFPYLKRNLSIAIYRLLISGVSSNIFSC